MSHLKQKFNLTNRINKLREEVLEYSLKMSDSGMCPATWGGI